MKKIKSQMKKGFTLVEMMVSVFIFLLLMTAIVQLFVQQIKAYRHARSVSNDVENAQFAMNYIAKTLRTATLIGSTTEGNLIDNMQRSGNYGDDFAFQSFAVANEGLILYDFSQEKCVIFTFNDASSSETGEPTLYVRNNFETSFVSYDEIERCLDPTVYDQTDLLGRRLTTGNVTGSFHVAPTRFADISGSRQTDTIGRATVTMKVLPAKDKLQRGKDPVAIHLQSTTSLRDYPSDLSF